MSVGWTEMMLKNATVQPKSRQAAILPGQTATMHENLACAHGINRKPDIIAFRFFQPHKQNSSPL